MIAPDQADTYDVRQLPDVIQPKGRMTERELRVAAGTSNALINLRTMLDKSSGGGTIQTAGGTLQLASYDVQACIALLIERGEILLQSYDIQLDREGTPA